VTSAAQLTKPNLLSYNKRSWRQKRTL